MKLTPAQKEALEGLRHGIQPRNSRVIKALLKRDLIEVTERYLVFYQVNLQFQRLPGTEVWRQKYGVKNPHAST